MVVLPNEAKWEEGSVSCIELNDGAEVNFQDAYMMEVLGGAIASKYISITTDIWTDCMATLKATADSWKATTRYATTYYTQCDQSDFVFADHALTFQTIRQTKSNLKRTRSHPEKHKDKTRAE